MIVDENLVEAKHLLQSLVAKRPNWYGDTTTLVSLAKAMVEFDKHDLETATEIGADRRRLERENEALRAALSLARVAVNFADAVEDDADDALAVAIEGTAAATGALRAAVDLQNGD